MIANDLQGKSGALDDNLLAVSVAQILYGGKCKCEIAQIVNFLHLLIALSKTYMQ